jgi:hypothetical protein
LIETDALVIEAAALTETEVLIEDLGKCIKPFVLSVERNVKFLLSQQKASLSSAESVLLKKDQEGFS